VEQLVYPSQKADEPGLDPLHLFVAWVAF